MKKLLAVFVVVLLITAGCGKEPASQPKDSQTQKNSQQTESTAENEDTKEGKEKRNDQGDTNILIEGDIVYKDHKLTVEGETNLLPDSLLKLSVDSISGFLIGTHDTVRVAEDGSFQLETALPTDYSHPYAYVEISFEPGPYLSQEIIEQYQEDGERLEGPFIRLFEENDKQKKIVAFNALVPIDEKGTRIPIEPPAWEVPDDYGASEVWLEADVEQDEKFVYIYGKSNLLEGSSVTGFLNVEGYITTGFSDSAYVNPDGSFLLIITHPSTLIKDNKEFTVNIKFSPKDEQSYAYVLDTYGEKGEKLEGSLVQKSDDYTEILYTEKIEN